MKNLDCSAEFFSKKSLKKEAQSLHQSLFKSKISTELSNQYIRAHEFIKPTGSNYQFKTIRNVIDLYLDVEAVELGIRKKNSQHPLLQKIKILTYLAECDPRYYNIFINEKSSFCSGLSILAYQVFRTAYKFIKGKMIVWRYSLV